MIGNPIGLSGRHSEETAVLCACATIGATILTPIGHTREVGDRAAVRLQNIMKEPVVHRAPEHWEEHLPKVSAVKAHQAEDEVRSVRCAGLTMPLEPLPFSAYGLSFRWAEEC